ncbi:MAG: hypothetical protein DBX44_08355 [Oscillospiraceae bacterium]|nr:MAG: hypothetical protein DBX44_08355 [Oscillospiraceae bacterium]
MALEKIGKVLGNIASTTAKKAGEQVQITRLGIDRAALEKQIEGVYAAIGRYCYSKAKSGDPIPDEILDYCRDIDQINSQIAAIDEEIARHRTERDAAEYTVAADMAGEDSQPLTFDSTLDEGPVETVESATAAFDEADKK